IDYTVELRLGALFAQDQWTIKDVTLNLGLRYDHLNGSSPANSLPAGRWVPARTFDAVSNTPNWNDINPRIGAAYSLFGSGRTVLKASLGRFLPLETTNAVVATANPSAATVTSATRTWKDSNGDYIPQEEELSALK